MSTDARAISASQAAPYHLLADLSRGLVQGAYAIQDLRAPGLVVWILVGFVPVLGTLAAIRDAYYSLEVRDVIAFLFNLLGLLPFMKGLANIMQVSRLHRIHRTAQAVHKVARVARHGRMVRTGRHKAASVITGVSHEVGAVALVIGHKRTLLRNRAAWPALLLALVAFAFFPLAMVAVLAVLAGGAYFSYAIPLPVAVGSGAGVLLCNVGVLALARHARHTARRLKGRPFSRSIVSAAAAWLAWLSFLESIVITLIILYVERDALRAL
jgi:hypothetical protein